MTEASALTEEYMAQRLRDVLAHDPRACELGIVVTVADGHVYLSGQVATRERCEAVAEVAAEVLPGHELHNDVTAGSWSEATEMETLS